MSTLRICLWSGPRNVSTALLYSFAQRDDTRVIDEPLYAHYLSVSGAEHPGRDDVLAALEHDGETVVRDVILGECDRPILFLKQMAHHLLDLDLDFMSQTTNVLLIRDPTEVLTTLVHQVPNPSIRDTGLDQQCDMLQDLRDRGQDPVVLDSRELLLDPRGVIGQLCERIGIEFDTCMLSWPAGAREEDGVWAQHWYQNVHRSTGFMPYKPKTTPFPNELFPLLEECRPYYAYLYQEAIRARPEAHESTDSN